MKMIWRLFLNADKHHRDLVILAGLALVVGLGLMALIREPGYTDAYYYYNAGERMAQGEGLTDPYLWNYLNAADALPVPSHTYWMPLASLSIALSQTLLGVSFTIAQIPSLLGLVGLTVMTGWLGYYIGQSRRMLWLPALLVLFGGFFFPFWLSTDTFTVFGLCGALALLTMGLGYERKDWRLLLATGVCSGLAHLARADGVLFLLVALLLLSWPRPQWRLMGAAILGYLVIMTPWFIRNLNVIGSPLPSGGINTAFLRGYNEFYDYPVEWSAANFWAWGWENILNSRWEALVSNFATWVVVENWALLGPLAVWAWWQRRREPLWLGFGIYALGLHVAMTLVFAYPGYRGALFHSSAALLPFWAVLGVIGLDASIGRMARWRRWHEPQARMVFGGAAVVLAIILSLNALGAQLKNRQQGPDYATIRGYLPDDAILMVNDPASWYYHTRLGGVALTNAPLSRVPEIAHRYHVTHLVLDVNVPDGFLPVFRGEMTPSYLELVVHLDEGTTDPEDDVRVYRFTLD